MDQAITIFAAGIGGVFIGMAMLYVAILVMPQVTNRLEARSTKNLETQKDNA